MSALPCPLPIIAAPMAGGPSTPALAAAVGEAGGLGFLAAGYLTPQALDEQLHEFEGRAGHPSYGVNLFLPSAPIPDPAPVLAYRRRLEPHARQFGVELGEPRWDDDQIDEKVAVVSRHRPAMVSFTFGGPSEQLCDRIRDATGALLIATVTSPAEAKLAATSGVDLLCVQGAEAGAHRGLFRDDPADPAGGPLFGLLELLALVRHVTDLPLIATGGMATSAAIDAALRQGAVAVQLGTAFLCCPEAGTSSAHRRALLEARFSDTIITRAFTGRPARGLANRFAREHTADAPAAYPEVHHVTRPLRAAAARAGDLDHLHLWAGTGWRQVTEEPAAELVGRLARDSVMIP